MPSERFYLGGGYSLRGYEADMAPPLGCLTNFCSETSCAAIGGKTMINVSVELRFDIYKNLGGVIFTDCGGLAQDCVKASYDENFVGATGFGFRYKTPVGPIRLDIGWKWKKHVCEKQSFAWFLTLGHAF